MRLTHSATVVLLSLILALPAGCQRTNATPPEDTSPAVSRSEPAAEPAAEAAPEAEPVAAGEKIKIKGYINVSSGCQQPTVDLLQRMAKESNRLELELIDFGTDEGNRRWRADGYDCMTILINGHQTVTYGEPGHRRIVTFSYPPGFQWLLLDLETALKDALAGKLYYGEEPGASKIQSRMPTLRVTAREATLNGRKVGEVLVNGQVAIRLRTAHDDLPPLQRAERATARLKRALAADFKPAQIHVTKLADGQVVLAIQDRLICIADQPQATMLKTTPKALATSWAKSLRKALTAALAVPQQ